jgi:integral membrane protein (TIGR01906 family)
MNSPTYAYQTNTATKKQYKILQIFFSLSLCLFIIFSAVKLTLMFKQLYYFDIQYLNIGEQSGYSKAEIVKNYDYVINYLLTPNHQEFKLPSIQYSTYGQIHFNDVKRIFTYMDISLIVTGLISILGLVLNIKSKNLDFLKHTSSMLIIFPTVLFTAIMINFDAAFVMFHKIFFRNDYWQFDPELDPIIRILPEEFFYHTALLIVVMIIFSIIAFKLMYKKLNIKKQVC